MVSTEAERGRLDLWMVFGFAALFGKGGAATESWTRLSAGPVSPSDSVQDFQPPFRSEYPSETSSVLGRAKQWWRHKVLGVQEPQAPSGYLTLIPLNGVTTFLRPALKIAANALECCLRTRLKSCGDPVVFSCRTLGVHRPD